MSNDSLETQSTSEGVQLGGSDLSLVDMIRVLSRFKILVISVILVVFGGSIFYAYTATPIYRAETTLAPMRGSGGVGGLISQFGGALGSLAGMVGMSGSTSAGGKLMRGEAYASLVSTSQIQSFIAEENLLPVLFSDIWDAEKEEWLVDEELDIPTLSDGYDLFMNEILVAAEDPATNLVILSVEWTDPVQAAEWANKLVGNLNSRLRSKAIESADKTIDFLNQELERTKVVELRQAIFYMMEQQVSSKTTARVQDEFAFKIINPAVAPDLDKYVRPERGFIVITGLFLGLFAGLIAAFLAFAISKLRDDYKKTAA